MSLTSFARDAIKVIKTAKRYGATIVQVGQAIQDVADAVDPTAPVTPPLKRGRKPLGSVANAAPGWTPPPPVVVESTPEGDDADGDAILDADGNVIGKVHRRPRAP
jgi:hypothetical protein